MTRAIPARDRLIVALDCGATEAIAHANALAGTVRWLKVGMTLFYQEGPPIVRTLQDKGFDIFLDLKLHDIPHQVNGAARAAALLGVQMLTVHASGGLEMMQAACEGSCAGADEAGVQPPSILAVTVLTSMGDDALVRVGVDRGAAAGDHRSVRPGGPGPARGDARSQTLVGREGRPESRHDASGCLGTWGEPSGCR
jgi:orotidine-5'-phosphate decarboxylase